MVPCDVVPSALYITPAPWILYGAHRARKQKGLGRKRATNSKPNFQAFLLIMSTTYQGWRQSNGRQSTVLATADIYILTQKFSPTEVPDMSQGISRRVLLESGSGKRECVGVKGKGVRARES